VARTPSNMVPLGSPAPDFRLPDVTREGAPEVALHDFDGAPALLVMFICNHCPFVVHIREPLARLVAEWQRHGVAVVGIASNDVERYPQDGPEPMAALAAEAGFTFPYLLDADQTVATAYQAACTPDFFLYDGARRLAYRGQLDASRPGNGVPVTGSDLEAAIDAVLGGRPAPEPQLPSLGCNIKWIPGREPPWYG
jgi:peroxiredoxin